MTKLKENIITNLERNLGRLNGLQTDSHPMPGLCLVAINHPTAEAVPWDADTMPASACLSDLSGILKIGMQVRQIPGNHSQIWQLAIDRPVWFLFWSGNRWIQSNLSGCQSSHLHMPSSTCWTVGTGNAHSEFMNIWCFDNESADFWAGEGCAERAKSRDNHIRAQTPAGVNEMGREIRAARWCIQQMEGIKVH